MPFRSVRTETAERLSELQVFHRVLVANEASLPAPPEHPTLKGHFIVGLYAYLEFTLQQIIKAAVLHINILNVAHKHIAPELFALLSEPKFMAANDSRGENRWHRRRELIVAIFKDDACSIGDSILAREIQNTRTSTIELIFKMFAITANPTDASITALAYYINELGERRNAVAHGREGAADVGGRFTAGALGQRLSALEQQNNYMITCFEEAAARRGFIRPNARRLYR